MPNTEPDPSPTPPALRLRHVSKTFGGVRALQDVSFEVGAGEVHCLAGENGCGKSTLIKIVTGVYTPEPGAETQLFGETVDRITPT
ncbi:MAG: ATP-binding cassette domain-containing protein, partial [Tabrizicola sp.]